ncbi:MAG: elongation factor P [Candidatus Wallbacteria bacterium]|nr:elongation factor P [Candidatus Wallbacteria bacterium]
MTAISPNEVRKGTKLLFEGDLYVVTETQHIAPGNWRAMLACKLKSLKSGLTISRTFRMRDNLERADVEEKKMDFLYKDQDGWHFMDNESYEQYQLDESELGEAKFYLKDGMACSVQLYEGRPVGIESPNFVDLAIVQTEPTMRGATAAGGYKPATLETGLIVKVPQFLTEGSVIRVDTRTNEYVERVK